VAVRLRFKVEVFDDVVGEAPDDQKWPPISEVRDTFAELVKACRKPDGTMPEVVGFTLERRAMRHLYAAERYLDELAIIHEAKASARPARRR